MNTKSIQEEIKKAIDKLGWSRNRLAREIYVATYDFDDDVEINKLEERLKKELTRATTKPVRLLEYLAIISKHNEFKNLDIVMPIFIESELLSLTLKSGLKSISKKLTINIESTCDS